MDTSHPTDKNLSRAKIKAAYPFNWVDRGRPMSEIGRMNNQNARWAIDVLARSLRHAIEEFEIPATVSHFLTARYPYDIAIRPVWPASKFGPIGINSIYWTNTPARSDAMYWSREFNGWRCRPFDRPDKALSLARWVDIADSPAHAWLAISTRSTSPDGALCCRWVPLATVMDWYIVGPSIPRVVLANCPGAPYDTRTKRFNLTADLLAQILGVKGWAS